MQNYFDLVRFGREVKSVLISATGNWMYGESAEVIKSYFIFLHYFWVKSKKPNTKNPGN
jgi:hypothetical protein